MPPTNNPANYNPRIHAREQRAAYKEQLRRRPSKSSHQAQVITALTLIGAAFALALSIQRGDVQFFAGWWLALGYTYLISGIALRRVNR